MNLTLSWDLLAIVFFALIITYTFIIGRHESVKMMLSTYIAIVAVQALGNLMQRMLGSTGMAQGLLGFSVDATILSITKLVLFVAIIIFLTVRAGFAVQYKKEPNQLLSMLFTGLFGFATAGLLLTTLITYVAGAPLLDMQLASAHTLLPIVQQSEILQFMITQQDLWFAFPAVLLGIVGFLHNA